MTKQQKKKNFERVVIKRVNEILDKLISLENLTNTSFYTYSSKDIEKIYTEISKQLENTMLILRGIKKKGDFRLWVNKTMKNTTHLVL